MKFCWVTLNIVSIEDSINFYKNIVGLKLSGRFNAGPNVEIAFLGDGETKIELICNKNNNSKFLSNNVSLGFEVKSLEDKIEFLKKNGIEVDGEIFEPNPNSRFFFIKDPNGINVQFVENK